MSKDKEKISKERATETLRDLVTAWLEESEFLSGYCLVPLSLLKEVEKIMLEQNGGKCKLCDAYPDSDSHYPTCALGKAIEG